MLPCVSGKVTGSFPLRSDYMRTNIVSMDISSVANKLDGKFFFFTQICDSDCVQESNRIAILEAASSWLIFQFFRHWRFWMLAFEMLLVGFRVRHLRLTHSALPRKGSLCCLLLIWPASFCQFLCLFLSFLLRLNFLLSTRHFEF